MKVLKAGAWSRLQVYNEWNHWINQADNCSKMCGEEEIYNDNVLLIMILGSSRCWNTS